MAFDIDIGFASQAGRKALNEDFCAAMLPTPGQEDHGSIVAIADGVLDAVGVALGCFTVAFAAMWLLGLACASAASLLVVGAVGYWRRA